MKKVLLLSAVVAMAFTSCSKKDLECTCTSSTSTVIGGVTSVETGPTTVTQFEGVKKSGAASDCPVSSSNVYTGEEFGGDVDPITFEPILVTVTETTTTTCSLD